MVVTVLLEARGGRIFATIDVDDEMAMYQFCQLNLLAHGVINRNHFHDAASKERNPTGQI